MLLSELLQYASTYNPLNESYNSSILKELLDGLTQSAYLLAPAKPKNSFSNDGYDFFDILWKYRDLIKTRKITQEQFDDPEVRESMFDFEYVQTAKEHQIRKNNQLVNRLNKLLQKIGCNIDLSKVQDSDIDTIYSFQRDEIKKPKYKTGLIFWRDYADRLQAVTYNGQTVFYTNWKSSWYKNNKDYTGPTDMDLIIDQADNGKEDELEKFIKNAFIEIPSCDPIFDGEKIKQKGLETINKLLKQNRSISAYFISKKRLAKLDITDKLNERKEYEEILKRQYKIQKEWIHMGKRGLAGFIESRKYMYTVKTGELYKRGAALRLSKRLKEVDDLLSNVFDNMYNITELLQTSEINYIQNDFQMVIKNSENKKDDQEEMYDHTPKWETAQMVIPGIYLKFFKEAMPNKIYLGEFSDGTGEKNTVYLDSVGDMFVLLNAHIQYILSKCNDLAKQRKEIDKMLSDKSNPADDISRAIKDILLSVDSVKNVLGNMFDREKCIGKISEVVTRYTGIQVLEIFKPFAQYYSKPSYYI